MPASAAPALPVEAVTITSALSSRARVTTIALARSLKEAVGLRDSSLIQRCLRFSFSASFGRANTGVQPAACKGVESPGGSLTGKRGRYLHSEDSVREVISSA